MQLQTAQNLQQTGDNLGYEIKVYADYSGKGMYGVKTDAVYGNLQEILHTIAVLGVDLGAYNVDPAETTIDTFLNDIEQLTTDNLGKDTIVY